VLAAARSTSTSLDLWHLVRVLWPLWVLIGAALTARAAQFLWTERRLRRSGIREIDVMDGPTFERRLAVLFGQLGYRVERTGGRGGDFGCDLLVMRGDERAVVQAKRWHKAVGVKAVQEASAARPYYKANGAYVVTEPAERCFCARCGEPVSKRVRDYCLARPKRFAGLVYCYDHQRSLGGEA
jgi:restriction system protein